MASVLAITVTDLVKGSESTDHAQRARIMLGNADHARKVLWATNGAGMNLKVELYFDKAGGFKLERWNCKGHNLLG